MTPYHGGRSFCALWCRGLRPERDSDTHTHPIDFLATPHPGLYTTAFVWLLLPLTSRLREVRTLAGGGIQRFQTRASRHRVRKLGQEFGAPAPLHGGR